MKSGSGRGKWEKPPEALALKFRQTIAGLSGVEPRQMFGCPCAFVNGQMFTGLCEASMFLRLGEADRAEFLALEDARTFEPMPDGPMREYVVVPSSMVDDARQLDAWLGRALAYAGSLPTKAPKRRCQEADIWA